jgi:hypothetical protein
MATAGAAEKSTRIPVFRRPTLCSETKGNGLRRCNVNSIPPATHLLAVRESPGLSAQVARLDYLPHAARLHKSINLARIV